MVTSATYITPSSSVARVNSKIFRSVVSGVFATLLLFLSVIAGFNSTKQEADAMDFPQWFMCSVLPEPANMVYQWTQTSDLQFLTRSKSAVTSGVDRIDNIFNRMLSLNDDDYKNLNENIVGYSSDVSGIEEALTEDEYLARYNKGTYVNPYDRFGVAGLKFTAYMGEWKYFVVDACSTSNSEPRDPQAGLFYENRLEPRSTWDDIPNSPDIRTQQFDNGVVSQYTMALGNTVANWVFNITKSIVVLTLSFINFSFSDISEVLGITDLVGAEGGVFSSLFSGVFMPLVFLMFVLTAGYIFYAGIVKRQYRTALTSVVRSLVLFVAAIVIAANPAFFISLPNNVAVAAQSVILVSMNATMTGGDQICATDIGQTSTDLVSRENDDDIDILSQSSKNMRSVIGCQFWQSFLLKPWAEGQFGTDWNNLWVEDKVPSWADKEKAGTLNNTNGSMVGEAEVPLGGGKTINNWAIYQLSAQTNVHSPTDNPGNRPKYTNGVANDWWRIVDALANYSEEEETDGIRIGDDTTEIRYQKVSDTDVSPYWNNWVGNNMLHRVGSATTSVLVAGVGVLAPLVFAALSIIYTLGIAILMAFAPIMLLLGCWAPRGWEIFKGWGELVLNTTMKRIATGLMLTISILFITAILKMTDELPWWQVLVGIVLISIVLIKSRHVIIDALASFRFASVNFSNTASRLTSTVKDKTINPVKTSGRLASTTLAAGAASAYSGGSFAKGAFAGAGNEFKNIAYRSKGLRDVMTSIEVHDAVQGGDILKEETACASCGKLLDYEYEQNGTGVFHGGRDASGNLICNECMIDGTVEDASEVVFHRSGAKDRLDRKRAEDEKMRKIYEAYSKKFKKPTVFSNNYSNDRMAQIKANVDHEDRPTTVSQRERNLKELVKGIELEIKDHEVASRPNGASMATTPQIPKEIEEYVDPELLAHAWETQQYDYIRMTYIAGFVSWYNENTGQQFEQKLDEVFEFITDGRALEEEIDEQLGDDYEREQS